MNVCTPCYNAGIYVDSCATGLSFWTVEPDSSYLVCLQHNATKVIQTFVTVSNQLGEITIEGIKVDPMQGYTLFVTNGGINSEQVDISINEVNYKCITFSIANSNAEPAIINLI